MSGTCDGGSEKTATDQNTYERAPGEDSPPPRKRSALVQNSHDSLRMILGPLVMLLLFMLEAPTRSRLWIDLWITFRGPSWASRPLTITEVNTSIFVSFPAQSDQNGLPLFFKGRVHMWVKCGKDVGPRSSLDFLRTNSRGVIVSLTVPSVLESPLFLGRDSPRPHPTTLMCTTKGQVDPTCLQSSTVIRHKHTDARTKRRETAAVQNPRRRRSLLIPKHSV